MPDYANARKTQIIEILKETVLHNQPVEGEYAGVENAFFLVHKNRTDISAHCLSRPMAGFVIQGEKHISFGSQRIIMKAGETIVTCVDVPSSFTLHNVSAAHPFLSVHFLLDHKIFADLLSEMPPDGRQLAGNGSNVQVLQTPPDFLETLFRLVELGNKPDQAEILAPLILRELHYLLLMESDCALLHDLYMRGARDNRIIDAIAWLKQNPCKSISVEDLARKVNMSVSSLHRHFKNITGFSPLQYHKQIRLYEAQRLMLAENERADMAAIAVGYESITQFNREYKRMFGLPPRRDIKRRKRAFESES